MSNTQPAQKPVSDLIARARDDVLYRDLAHINEQVRRQLGPLPNGGLDRQPRRKPHIQLRAELAPLPEILVPEVAVVNIKHTTVLTALAALSLAACEGTAASSDAPAQAGVHAKAPVDVVSPKLDAASDLQEVVQFYATVKSSDWAEYDLLSRVKWIDSSPKQFLPDRYSRMGKVLLLGFGENDLPNGKTGADYDEVRGNEGESSISLFGDKEHVDSITIRKFYFSSNYSDVLRKQVGQSVQIREIAAHCSAGADAEGGAGEGAFFELTLPQGSPVYVQAAQEDGGKYSPGATMFKLSRNKPVKEMTESACEIKSGN